MNYNEYTHKISKDQTYYGSGCSQSDADRIFESLGNMIRNQFPGIQIDEYRDGDGSCITTGPDEDVVSEIELWVSENWTAAL